MIYAFLMYMRYDKVHAYFQTSLMASFFYSFLFFEISTVTLRLNE